MRLLKLFWDAIYVFALGMKYEKCTLKDLEYGEKTENHRK